jgi:hypothetical protein
MLGLYGVVCGVTVMLHHKTKSLKTAIITDRKPSILKGAMT